MRLSLALQALKTAYLCQAFQSLSHGDPSARQGVLNTLGKTIKRRVKGHNHERLPKLYEQDLTSFRKFVQLTVPGRNRNLAFIPYSNRFNWTSKRRMP